MELVKVYYQKNDPDYQVHEFLLKNGVNRFYSIDPHDEEVIKIPIKASMVKYRFENGYLLSYDDLSPEQKETLEWSKKYFEKKRLERAAKASSYLEE